VPWTVLQCLIEADVIGFTLKAGDCIVYCAWGTAVIEIDTADVLGAATPVSCEACTVIDAFVLPGLSRTQCRMPAQ